MKTVRLTIDGRPVEVPAGASLLDAARALGLDIPTLCYLEQCGPMTSCLACLVKVAHNGAGRLVPSCATQAVAGMVVESETPEVHAARRTALELLLSDHVGDCLSPCHRICPLQLNIPVMIRQIQAGELAEAILTVREAVALPLVTGRLCHAPCENGCRRGTGDQPAAIRELERFVADADWRAAERYVPVPGPASGKSVVIVGAGPAGLTAAFHLLRDGHRVTVLDRRAKPGGTLLNEVDEGSFPPGVLEAELQTLRRLGARFAAQIALGMEVTIEGLLRGFDAVLLTVGQTTEQERLGFGLAATVSGLKVDADTYQTSRPAVFAAGSAVKPIPQVVRAMAEGKRAAACVSRFLQGQTLPAARKVFSSSMGRVTEDEVRLFARLASPAPRAAPREGPTAGFTAAEASGEAARCLHCDCRAVEDCRLRHYAQRYGAEPGHYRTERRRFEQQLQPGGVLFEPGKCILCGICVKLTEQAREPLGLTFVGRGFEVRVGVPFNRSLEEGLQRVATECVAACPTGALAWKSAPPTSSPGSPCRS